MSALLLSILIAAGAPGFDEREQKIACANRVALVYYAFWAKEQNLPREKYRWTSEFDEDTFSVDTRRLVDGVWQWEGGKEQYMLVVRSSCNGKSI